MDYSNGNELFQWQGGDSFLQRDSTLDISDITWDGDTQDEDFSYILEETTPVKACGGSAYNFGYCGKRRKESDECQVPPSRVKRRRVLQFDDDDFDLTSQIDDLAFLKSKENINEAFSDSSQQGLGSQEASSFSGLECLDQVEDWLGGCFNYPETTHNPSTHMSSCGTTTTAAAADVLLDISEFIDPPPTMAAKTVQKQAVRSSRNVAFIGAQIKCNPSSPFFLQFLSKNDAVKTIPSLGTKSYIRTPTALAAFKIHPFTFIKPSEANGDMTLKEINRRIQAPPADDDAIYGTSAFSGKPVVNKTRIRTEGGKGSITIMRTKG